MFCVVFLEFGFGLDLVFLVFRGRVGCSVLFLGRVLGWVKVIVLFRKGCGGDTFGKGI